MEAAVQGLAAIVVNAYRGATESRGARGSAGSGSGTRTLVDGLSLSMAHNHWLAVNHLDLHASLPLQIPDHDDEDNGDDDGGGDGGGDAAASARAGAGGGGGGGSGGMPGEDGGTGAPDAAEAGRHRRGFEAPSLDAAKVREATLKSGGGVSDSLVFVKSTGNSVCSCKSGLGPRLKLGGCVRAT